MRRLINRTREKYRKTSLLYDILDWPWEFFRYRKIRPGVWERVKGYNPVLDAGCGTGRNIASYPRGMSVVGVDLSEGMLRKYWKRKSGKELGPVCASVTELPFADETFAATVSTFLFCVLADEVQTSALQELWRVTKPGGKLAIVEYVYSSDPAHRRRMERFAPLVEWLYGARFDRKTAEYLVAAGWRLEEESFLCGDFLKLIVGRKQ